MEALSRRVSRPVYSLIYRSTACYEMEASTLEAILLRSRAYNSGCRITGLLLYNNRQFMQLLEGSASEVQHLLLQIRQDPRHTALEVLLEGPQPHRIFPNWSMGFTQIESPDFIWLNGYIDPQKRADVIPPTYDTGKVIMDLLTEFMEGRQVSL